MTRRKSSKPEPQGRSGPGPLAGTENLVLLQVLRDDHSERWTREELRRELVNIDPEAIDESLKAMEAAGVVVLDGDHVEPSRCARWFDAHYLVTI
jgi:DNA-binding HxlR family transcriptional regulator